MCLATVYVEDDGQREEVMQDVAWIKPANGGLELIAFLGESKLFQAHIESIDLMNSLIVLKRRSGMGTMTAQVSLYPLRQASIGPPIHEAVRVFREHGLETHMGEMSTLMWGGEQAVFDALQDAFHLAAEGGDTVMTVTLSNACPSPEEP